MSTSPNSWQLSVDPGASSVSLTFLGDTTPNITDLSATGIQTALENLANVGEGNGSVLMNADGSFCVTITADLGNADPALALVGTAIGAIINIEPISQAEASLRAQLLQMDAANAPGLAAAAAAVTASLNAYTGTNASWNLVIGSGVNQFTLTFLSQTTPEIPVPGLTAAQIQTALQALSSLGSSNCVVNANPDGSYTISLSGALADTAEPANALTGIPDAGTMTITQTNPGNAPAGSDQNAAIQSAQADFNSALSAATTAMGTIGTSLTTASTEAGAIAGPVDQGSAIAVITT
ncbi:MAG TPA: hypothetical protein VJX67_10250, partial [Blastocatellia bacterium]|nr:hypothetical protein [Blastocatellia bacterium]